MPFFSQNCRVEYMPIPRVASTSIIMALLESDEQPSIQTQAAFRLQRWETLPAGFESVCRFTFVRHPLDRLVSIYHQMAPRYSFGEWMHWMLSQRRERAPDQWKPQSLLLRGYGMTPDFIGHFESIDKDWQILRTQYGLPILRRWEGTSTRVAPWQAYYRSLPELLERAIEWYAEDFETFHYSRHIRF